VRSFIRRAGNQFAGKATIFFYDMTGALVDRTPPFDLQGTRITPD